MPRLLLVFQIWPKTLSFFMTLLELTRTSSFYPILLPALFADLAHILCTEPPTTKTAALQFVSQATDRDRETDRQRETEGQTACSSCGWVLQEEQKAQLALFMQRVDHKYYNAIGQRLGQFN